MSLIPTEDKQLSELASCYHQIVEAFDKPGTSEESIKTSKYALAVRDTLYTKIVQRDFGISLQAWQRIIFKAARMHKE